MIETSNESIDFRFLTISQLFRFERYGEIHIKVDDRWALKVNEGSCRKSGLLCNNLGIKVYPVLISHNAD